MVTVRPLNDPAAAATSHESVLQKQHEFVLHKQGGSFASTVMPMVLSQCHSECMHHAAASGQGNRSSASLATPFGTLETVRRLHWTILSHSQDKEAPAGAATAILVVLHGVLPQLLKHKVHPMSMVLVHGQSGSCWCSYCDLSSWPAFAAAWHFLNTLFGGQLRQHVMSTTIQMQCSAAAQMQHAKVCHPGCFWNVPVLCVAVPSAARSVTHRHALKH